ncbi:peptidylprolyl isomerase [Bradyrhizobium rifense]|nr:peptidylprolyl isomerase [Bradyrhizobium rifense]
MVLNRDRHPLSSGLPAMPGRTIAALVMAASLFAAGGPCHGQAAASETVIAKVDELVIDQTEYDLALQAFAGDMRGLDEKSRHDFLVQYLIDLKLMAREARKENLALDEAALQRNFDFQRNKALMEKLLGTVAQAAITDQSVRAAYDRAVKDVTSEPEVRMKFMHFKVADIKDENAVAAVEAKAKEAVERVKKGEDFAKVSEEMTGTSAPATLIEANFMNKQQMGRDLAPVAADLNIGAVSAPIKTELGWDVVRIEDKRTRTPPEFGAVRDRFVAVVGRQAQLELMEKLRAAAKIERSASAQPSEGEPTTAAQK